MCRFYRFKNTLISSVPGKKRLTRRIATGEQSSDTGSITRLFRKSNTKIGKCAGKARKKQYLLFYCERTPGFHRDFPERSSVFPDFSATDTRFFPDIPQQTSGFPGFWKAGVRFLPGFFRTSEKFFAPFAKENGKVSRPDNPLPRLRSQSIRPESVRSVRLQTVVWFHRTPP